MSTEPGKNNDGLSSVEGDSLSILPKAEDKSAGVHTMQPPIFPFGPGLPSSGAHIPDSPAELSGDPLKEGASARIDEVVSDIKEDNYRAAVKRSDPGMSEDEADAYASLFTEEPLSEDRKQELKGKLKQLSQEKAKGIIEASPLTIKDKVDIIAWADKELSPMSEEEKQKALPQNEQEQMQANMGAMGEQLEQMKEQAEEAQGHSEGKHHSERVERMLEKIEELREKMDEFLHPEDPLKTWATRGGKTLYVILMVSFLFVIWEMNIINKMAGGKRGGGH